MIQISKVLGGQQRSEKITSLPGNGDNYEQIKMKLNDYFQEKRSINAIRHEFFSTKPRKGENTRCYAERCKEIAKECEFEQLGQEDAVLLNICKYTSLEKVRNEILVKELKLNEAVKYGTSLEMAMQESSKMRKVHESEEEREIQLVKKPSPYSRKAKMRQAQEECSRCGRAQPHTCRALTGTCYNCNKKGHFANKCRNKQRKVHRVEDVEQEVELTETDTSEDF